MKKKYPKGSCGYVQAEKKRRLLLTLILFAIPLLIFFSGLTYNGTRKNILTVVAILGCLPACKYLVSFIMMAMVKPMKKEVYHRIAEHAEGLTMAYELYFTTYEENTFTDAAAICGNQLVCYSSRLKDDGRKLEKHLSEMMSGGGFAMQVKVIGKLDVYLERLRFLTEHQEALRAGVKEVPCDGDEERTREEQIRDQLLALAL